MAEPRDLTRLITAGSLSSSSLARDSNLSLLAGYIVTIYSAFEVFSISFVFLQTFENFKGTKNGSTYKLPNVFNVK